MSCQYCEEERNLFASAEGRACDIDEVAVGRLCFLSKDKQPKESYAIVVTFDNSDYCYTKDINYCPMCGAKLGGDANGA